MTKYVALRYVEAERQVRLAEVDQVTLTAWYESSIYPGRGCDYDEWLMDHVRCNILRVVAD